MFLPSFSLPPSSATCFLYSHFTIATKVLELLDFAMLGQAKRAQEWHHFGCVCSWATTHTKCTAITWSSTTIKRARAFLIPLSFPRLCVFIFAYLSISLAITMPLCYCRNKSKMWRSVTVKRVGALLAPLSFPLVFILSASLFICFAIVITMFILCCKNKGEGFINNNLESVERAWAFPTLFLHLWSICSHVYHHRHYFTIKKAQALLVFFLHP